ncbi:MAG: hypothetical protein RMN51_08820 [Verrucomicrobiota bacterium]|nr:hypothetical protein [Limisphaera sp.]MDW8382193.1 hypothetical protein [Verrucomicrobiota bacterium]
MKGLGLRWLWGKLLITTVTSGPATAAARLPPPPEWLPPQTVAWVTIPSCQVFRRQWQSLAVARLWNDPAFELARRHFLNAWSEHVLKPAEEHWAISWSELTTWPEGQWTWALVRLETEPGEPAETVGAVMVLELHEHADRALVQLEKLQQRWNAAGKETKFEWVRGVRFLILSMPGGGWLKILTAALQRQIPEHHALEGTVEPNSATAKVPSFELAIAVHEGAIWLTDSLPLMERILARLQGAHAACLENSGHADPQAWAGLNQSVLFGWLCPRAWDWKQDPLHKDARKTGEVAGAAVRTFLDASGLHAVQTITLRMVAGPDDWQCEVLLHIPQEQRTRLLKFLDFLPLEAGPPEWLPGDLLRFYRFRISGSQLWFALQQTATKAGPAWQRLWTFLTDTMEQAGRRRDPTFQLARDLIPHLGDDWMYWQVTPRGAGWDALEQAPGLLLVGSPNPPALARAAVTVLSGAAPRPDACTSREFLGRTIYSLPRLFGPPPTAPEQGSPWLHVVGSDRYVAFASEPALLENWLRSLAVGGENSTNPSLGEGARGQIAAARGCSGYENYPAILHHTLLALQSDPDHLGQASLPGPLGFALQLHMPPERWRPWLSPELLPGWEAWAPYLAVGLWTGCADSDQIRCLFRLVPVR